MKSFQKPSFGWDLEEYRFREEWKGNEKQNVQALECIDPNKRVIDWCQNHSSELFSATYSADSAIRKKRVRDSNLLPSSSDQKNQIKTINK